MIRVSCHHFFTSIVSLLCFLLLDDGNIVNGLDRWLPVYTRPFDYETSCSICDHLDLPMNYDVPVSVVDGKTYTCRDVDLYFKSEPTARVNCSRHFPFWAKTCCNFTGAETLNTYECEANVRDEILAKDNIKTIPPFPGFGNPIIIETELRHEMLHQISVKESTASLYVTIGLKWHDPRLAWNISAKSCITSLRLRASESVEETEIWVPDYDLLNRMNGVNHFDLTNAIVTHDGTVTWERSGQLTAFCSFSGMERIPFDTLGCQLIFGSHLYESSFRFVSRSLDSAFTVGTFQQKYKEFTLLPNKTNVTIFLDNNGFVYDIFYQRASTFYTLKIILPTCFFTFISFGLFIMHMDSGERIGFGVSVVLVIIAQEIITNDYIPLGSEQLWLTMFIQGSTYFTFLSLFETIMMNWLYYFYLRKQKDNNTRRKNEELLQQKEETATPSSSTATNPKEPMVVKSLSFLDDKNTTKHKDEEIAHYSCDESKESAKEKLDIETTMSSRNDINKEKEANSLVIGSILNSDDKKSIKETTTPKEDNRIADSPHPAHSIGDETWSLLWRVTPSSLKNIESEEDARALVKKIDNICLALFPISYVIFIIVMFQFNKSMNVENDSWYRFPSLGAEL